MTNVDPTWRALGSTARYQLLQACIINLGSFGADYQLIDNVFTGRDVEGLKCAPPDNGSTIPEELQDIDWNSSQVQYGQCQISVNRSHALQHHDCPFGYSYGFPVELSFRTEFDLVCDYALLGALVQSLVIVGQGVGAVISAILSDRFGRKPVLVVSQLALLVLGVGVGLAPNYAVLVTLKFVIGCFQQGVVTSMSTMSTELFPTAERRLINPLGSVMFNLASTSMALFAWLLRSYTWRYLQYALSAASLVFIVQLLFVDESLRWAVTNGKKKMVTTILERAARINKKDYLTVLKTLQNTSVQNGSNGTELENAASPTSPPEKKDKQRSADPSTPGPDDAVEKSLEGQVEKLTILDIFRHKRLLINAAIIWFAWFTCAFAFFALVMMSTTFVGNRFLNYALIVLMESPAGFIFFFAVNRFGRKRLTQLFYLFCGVGLIVSGVCRIFEDMSALATLSVVMAMLGMVGASGMFGALFFYTPEIFPTNMRNQALGVSSFAGRLGGMLAPFMVDFAKLVIWGPGVMIGSLSLFVVFLFKFLPETQGTVLPQTVADVKAWYKPKEEKTDQNSQGKH